MDLIVGGIAQGKREYCRRQYGAACFSAPGTLEGRFVCGLETLIRREGEDALALVEAYLERVPDAVLICDEVGCGIVPLDREEREYRDRVGRICQRLAARAEHVVRVVCGIGEVLK